MMDWYEWKPLYLDIVRRLNLEIEQDYRATEILNDLVTDIKPDPLLRLAKKAIHRKTVVILGAGPSLQEHIEKLSGEDKVKDSVFIAADGAVSALVQNDMQPHIVVTDLDGDKNDLFSVEQEGAIIIVHGHGDNIDSLQESVPKMRNVLGSTQVEPQGNVFLWGGFTDGDRACFFASHYYPKRLVLAGMDFGDVVGKWSKPDNERHFKASSRKRIKLEIAQELLQYLWENSKMVYEYL